MNLVEAFLAQVEARPDAAAIIAPDGRVTTYAELARVSNTRARAWARAGIGAGDVVLIARGVSVELYETLLAVFRLGAVAMFPEPAAGLKGLRLAVDAAQPMAVVTTALGHVIRLGFRELRALKGLPEPGDDDVGEEVLAHLPALEDVVVREGLRPPLEGAVDDGPRAERGVLALRRCVGQSWHCGVPSRRCWRSARMWRPGRRRCRGWWRGHSGS